MQYRLLPQPIYHFEPITYQFNFQPIILANITQNPEKQQDPPLKTEDSFETSNDKVEAIMGLLSPNSKASTLLSKSKRIFKPKSSQSPQSSPLENSAKLLNKKRRTPWTPSEDQKLLHFFSIYGAQWAKIAASMGERTGKQVRDRYLSVLIENINKGPWTEEEDKIILDLYEKIGAQWCRISDHLQGRTEVQVKNRFNSHIKRREVKTEFYIKEGNNKFEGAVNSNGIMACQIPYWNMHEMLFGKQ